MDEQEETFAVVQATTRWCVCDHAREDHNAMSQAAPCLYCGCDGFEQAMRRDS